MGKGAGKDGCSGRARLWDSPTEPKFLGVQRSPWQPGCEEGLALKRKPAGEARPSEAVWSLDANCGRLSSGNHISRHHWALPAPLSSGTTLQTWTLGITLCAEYLYVTHEPTRNFCATSWMLKITGRYNIKIEILHFKGHKNILLL